MIRESYDFSQAEKMKKEERKGFYRLCSFFCTPHCKKRLAIFLSPAGMSLTKLFLGRNNLYMTSLFPPRESLVSDILAGDGKLANPFYSVPPFHNVYSSFYQLVVDIYAMIIE